MENIIFIKIISIILVLVALSILLSNLERHIFKKNAGFNNDKFIKYISKNIQRKEKISLLKLSVRNDENEYRKEVIIDNMIRDILFLKKKQYGAKIFRISNNEIIICSKDKEAMKEIAIDLKKTIEEYLINLNYANRSNCSLVYLEDTNIVSSYIELNELLNKCRLLATKSLLNVDIVNVDENMMFRIKQEEKMVETIDYALNNDKILLDYQAVYSTKEDRIVSCEALVRLQNENGETLLPNDFIGVAEKYDRIYLIGKKTLDIACKFFNEVNKEKQLLKDISINFSPHEIEDYRTINNIIDAVKENKLNPTNLCIEIANANDYRNEEDYFYNIQKLVSFGVEISITGYGDNNSNLNYIIGYPINLLRFDRKYMWDSLKNKNNKAVFDAAIKIANDYGIKTVAVGVENKEQYETLVSSGVDYLQGMYISSPLKDKNFIKLINSKKGEE